MSQTMAVVRREVLDAIGDCHSVRGFVIQSSVLVLLTGIIVPGLDGSIWDNAAAPIMLWVVFPATLAATIAADAFAGEIERGTLETLLATPLGEWPIVLGKLLTAVLFVTAVSALALTSGLIVASVRGVGPAGTEIGVLVVGVLMGALAAGLVVADAVLIISMRVFAARSAQQIGGLITYLVAGAVAGVLGALGRELDWTVVMVIAGVLLFIGVLGAFAGRHAFRRDRFFE